MIESGLSRRRKASASSYSKPGALSKAKFSPAARAKSGLRRAKLALASEPAKLLPAAAVLSLGGRRPRGFYHVVIARCARSEESTGVDSEERRSLSEEKLLRSLSEPVSGKPTPRLVGTRCARGERAAMIYGLYDCEVMQCVNVGCRKVGEM